MAWLSPGVCSGVTNMESDIIELQHFIDMRYTLIVINTVLNVV